MSSIPHSLRVYKTSTQEEHDRITITGYSLRQGRASDCCVAQFHPSIPKAKTTKQLCQLLRDGWEIATIFYSETKP